MTGFLSRKVDLLKSKSCCANFVSVGEQVDGVGTFHQFRLAGVVPKNGYGQVFTFVHHFAHGRILNFQVFKLKQVFFRLGHQQLIGAHNTRIYVFCASWRGLVLPSTK